MSQTSGAGPHEAPTIQLRGCGQDLWLSYLRRLLVQSGELGRLIEGDGVAGVCSDLDLFADLVSCGAEYSDELGRLLRSDADATAVVDALLTGDVAVATAALSPVHERSSGRSGWAAVDLPAYAAESAPAAVGWWQSLLAGTGAANVMVKVAATDRGLAMARELIGHGASVYLTHVFCPAHTEGALEAYLGGVEAAIGRGHSAAEIRVVAALNLVRIDVAVDELLRSASRTDGADRDVLEALIGRAAVAVARRSWELVQETTMRARWRRLAAAGAARLQLAWEGTRTSDPARRDIEYVEQLIGPDSICVVSRSILAAFRERGAASPRLAERAHEGRPVIEELAAAGIDLVGLADGLQEAAARQARDRVAALCNQVEQWREAGAGPGAKRAAYALGDLEAEVAERVAAVDPRLVARLFDADAGLWSTDPLERERIHYRLGWLHLPEAMREEALPVVSYGQARGADAGPVVLLGMGGSSLGAEACRVAYEATDFTVLDTTVPEGVAAVTATLDREAATVIVASKSGSTVETDALAAHFYATLGERPDPGSAFLAVTDPGTPLHEKARNLGYDRVWMNPPDVGGRYSVLSLFGLVPMAMMGIEVSPLLRRATRMAALAAPEVGVRDNPAVQLGACLAAAVASGYDKLTFLSNRRLEAFGDWLEQLIAESLGKDGLGLVPVSAEPLGDAEAYGRDRLFVRLRFSTDDAGGQQAQLWSQLQDLGHPTVDIELGGPHDLGAEFLRWELAVAIAGSMLAINPFDEPDVSGAKKRTAELLEQLELTGEVPDREPVFRTATLSLYADAATAAELADQDSLAGWVGGHLGRAAPPDYLAIQAFLAADDDTRHALQGIRALCRDWLGVATTLGWGPRFLHSTGQLHKGGPDSGVFLQVTARDSLDIDIPGRSYGFGELARAQALGDLNALESRSRRVLRVHINDAVGAGLAALTEAARLGLSGKAVAT